MSFLKPERRHTEFQFHAHGDIPDFAQRVADIKQVYEGMSEIARLIIPGEHCSSIHLYEGAVPEKTEEHTTHAKYSKGDRKIEMSTRSDFTEIPEFLRPLYSDFNFTTAHELHHPVILKIAAIEGRKDEGYQSARFAALARIRTEYPKVQAMLDPIITALHERNESQTPNNPDYKASIIAMPGIGSEYKADEQVAFYLGLMLSDEYHKAFGYTMDVLKMRPDTTYDEDLCNVRALAHKFGADNVKAVAGELEQHIGKREGLYRQLLNTKEAYADWIDTYNYQERVEWQGMIRALEDQFPGGGESSSMGMSSKSGRSS